MFFIKRENINDFLNIVSIDHTIYYLTDDLLYKQYKKDIEKLNIDTVRSFIPIKSFFLSHGERITKETKTKNTIVFGVKSCDIKSLKIIDKIFLDEPYIDTTYQQKRNSTIIISSDCFNPKESCFCYIVDGAPYPTDGFDLNFSPVEDGWIVTVETDKGKELMDRTQAFFSDATEQQVEKIKEARENSIKKIKEINSVYLETFLMDLQGILKQKYQSDLWREFSKKCVQCLGCRFICPTCYCFFFEDTSMVKKEISFEKTRYWDSCLSTSYARVAGGLNPRPHTFERFRNLYQCKFNYRKTNFGVYACTGCGRCLDMCPGRIDIRKNLSEITT